MKSIIFLIATLFSCFMVNSQTVLYHENFDQPSGPDSVNTLVISGVNPTIWNDTSTAYTSPSYSYHLKGSEDNSEVVFQTQAFSPTLLPHTYIKFQHICKISTSNQAYIEVSVDSGTSWYPAGFFYFGSSSKFSSVNHFNSESYPTWKPLDTAAIPNNLWWREELFEISNIITNGGSGPPASSVMIRFRAKFNNSVNALFQNGWYIDDLQVLGSIDEIVPPDIKIVKHFTQNCNENLVIRGPQQSVPGMNEIRYFNIQENDALDSARLVQVINGNAPVYSNLTSSTSTNQYIASFSNYSQGDTINWKVEAFDVSGNLASFPDTGFYSFYLIETFPKCPGGDCNQGHYFINKFPWFQNFEDSTWISGDKAVGSNSIRGDFPEFQSYNITPAIGQTWGWSINNGVTPTSQTGPSGDYTSTSGNGKYLYTEFYGQNGLSGSGFELPCVDLRDSTARMLSFFYHMYGSDIKRLSVQVDSSSNNTTANWHVAKAINGQQHSSEANNWSKAFLDLSPYIGKIVKIRFFGVKEVSTTKYANIAIDDLEITDIHPVDISLEEITSPSLESMACFGTSNLSLSINTAHIGHQATTKVPLAYQIDNNPIVVDTLDLGGKTFGFDTNYTFNTSFTLTPSNPHLIKAWSAHINDANRTNDTLQLEVPVQKYQAINTFPHLLDFENQLTNPTLNSTYWSLARSLDSLTFWEIEQGPFINERSSPHDAQGKDGKALVIRKSSGHNQSYAAIESQCIDLSGLTSPVLQFMFYGEASRIEIFVKTFGASTWNQPLAFLPQPASKKPMSGFTLSLAAYSGQVIQLKIIAKNPSQLYGITVIDNIMIREQPSQDLEIKKVELDRIYENQTTYPTVRVFYTNWAQPTGANFSKVLKVELKDKCSSSPIVYTAQTTAYNYLGNDMNGYLDFSNLAFNTQVPAGEYSAKIWVESTSDIYPNNDTVFQDLICLKGFELPYVNDFENCDNQVYLSGSYQQWDIGQGKNSLDSLRSGNSCGLTNLTANSFTAAGAYDYLELPPFSGLDTLYGAKFGFLQSFSFANPNSFGVVEIFDGQQWNQLTDGVYYGTNWRSYISKTIGDIFYSKGFTGNSNGWIHSSYPLAEYNSPGEKIIRFVSHTEGVPGWAIDSIYIDYPEQNSGAPVEFILQGNVAQAGANMVNLKVKNTASAPLDEIEITVEHNGTVLHNQHAVFNPALAGGQTALVALSQSLQLDSTMSQLLVYTSRPNNRKDEITADDTLIIPIRILGTADSNQSCFDFEHNSDFSPYSTVNGLNNTGWEKGSPQKTIIDSTYAGSSCWFTSGNEYDIQQNSYLYTPEFAVNGTYCYRLGFWHQFDFEKNFDGGNVEYTLDGGNEWKALGHYWSTDTTWYNHQFIQSLNGNKPGWSGSSNGWIYSNFDFNVFWNDTVQFRFRYATDADINYEGWAIDNVCFEPISSNCSSIGMEEQEAVQPEISLYPNPASTELNLQCGLEGIYEISIYSAKGELVKSCTENLETGKTLKINIEELTPGFYSIGINNSNSSISKRFVKTR